MPRYVAFLRAVNVGGRIVKMDELRGHFERAGFEDVETFIASGNVIFSSGSKTPAAIEAKIEGALKKALGYDVPAFVRTPDQVVAAVERTEYSAKERAAAVAYCIGFLKAPLDGAAQKRLAALGSTLHAFRAPGSELHWLLQIRQGESEIKPAHIEKALGGPTTIRAISSLEKLAAKHCGT